MNTASVLILAFAIGVIAGLRSLTAPMVVSWAVHLHWINVQHTWAAFLDHAAVPYFLTLLALAELVVDKLPMTPSRKALPSFAFRVFASAFAGGVLSARAAALLGVICGGLGAVAGTLGGYEARTRLVKGLNVRDFAIAFLEDAVAVGGGFLLVSRF